MLQSQISERAEGKAAFTLDSGHKRFLSVVCRYPQDQVFLSYDSGKCLCTLPQCKNITGQLSNGVSSKYCLLSA